MKAILKGAVIEDVWYKLQVCINGKWEDAGDQYEEQTLKECVRNVFSIDFYPNRVRVVKHFHGWIPVKELTKSTCEV